MRDPRVNGLYLLFELAALNYTGAYAAFSAGEGGGVHFKLERTSISV